MSQDKKRDYEKVCRDIAMLKVQQAGLAKDLGLKNLWDDILPLIHAASVDSAAPYAIKISAKLCEVWKDAVANSRYSQRQAVEKALIVALATCQELSRDNVLQKLREALPHVGPPAGEWMLAAGGAGSVTGAS